MGRCGRVSRWSGEQVGAGGGEEGLIMKHLVGAVEVHMPALMAVAGGRGLADGQML